MRLVFATNNAHKLQEVRQILPAAYEVLSLGDIGFHQEIEETGETLADNSLLKAQTIWDWIQEHPTTEKIDGIFADDTGLEVDALGGQPGVYSARYAGDPCTPAENRQKLLKEMQGIIARSACFRTVVTLIENGKVTQLDGAVKGTIATEESGDKGFGYDNLFIPQDYHCTFADLSAEEKNRISHRGRAIQNLKQYLEKR